MTDSKKRKHLSPLDKSRAKGNMGMPSTQIYEVVRREGMEELARPVSSLFWSGIAAGIVLSLSIYCKAFLYGSLAGSSLQGVLSNCGYTVGFIIVILGRLQLFTENTISVVLPVLGNRTLSNFKCTARLWAVVFIANILGAWLSAFFAFHGAILPAEHMEAALAISHHLLEYSAIQTLLYGIPAGFMVASIVWVLPSAKGNEFWVIFIVTYMIALGAMTHVVAGATEWFLLALNHELSWLDVIFKCILPALLGNIIGGTGLFALISYAQVKDEI
ncbi:formate/nitrite transporter family protein [Coraliomargarita sp. SDUM461004]|uniref:Formate/nitrite transporter family protein n=1 Tax=Thalassobacterium sedimentorum TaxID=3041258 RepID=A0ABU1AK69_9BACT|nr:formate/nitrite transporter family protein [Coraliomargarita sp. SDUM461004]MDQ8195210.1 formate/nitrite transporter family protein [Coraliomargarita sp. SDUM461004]